ncbi:MAG TPA: carbamoyltransferase C-terminal domain-containing protein [Polyangia bacterium]|jgi:carbamoyltransferase
MDILGISFSNDAAAALVRDGAPHAAIAEERYARVKHFDGFPAEAVRFCLRQAGRTLPDVDHVAFFWNPAVHLEPRLARRQTIRHHAEYLYALPNQLLQLHPAHPLADLTEQVLHFQDGVPPLRLAYVEHHLAHAAAFFVSPFDHAAIVTIDGYGERPAALIAAGEGGRIRPLVRVDFPHSLGALYAAVTQYLGFRANSGEGKVMGLASYGRPRFAPGLRELVRLLPGGRFELDLSYFSYFVERRARFAPKFVERFGPAREPESPLDERHQDMAASLQAVFEDIYGHLIAEARRLTGATDLVLAGGAALNCVANGVVPQAHGFTRLYVPPAAGDDGAALGAALYLHHQHLGRPRAGVVHDHAYLGPDTLPAEVDEALAHAGCPSARVGARAPALAARLLADGFIAGWYQGRAEFGPRALGARSILADPRPAEMKDVLNARVKFREPFRPFAPSVLEEQASALFEGAGPSPFMLVVRRTRPERLQDLRAVTHVDGGARVQTVSRAQNPAYYELIAEFGRLTGVPCVLNTSFNVRGEPIVNTPKDALRCFFTCDLDFLFLGEHVLWKPRERCRAALRAAAPELAVALDA